MCLFPTRKFYLSFLKTLSSSIFNSMNVTQILWGKYSDPFLSPIPWGNYGKGIQFEQIRAIPKSVFERFKLIMNYSENVLYLV